MISRVLVSFFTEPRADVIQEKRYEAEDDALAGFYSTTNDPSPFSRQRTAHEGQLGGEGRKGKVSPLPSVLHLQAMPKHYLGLYRLIRGEYDAR